MAALLVARLDPGPPESALRAGRGLLEREKGDPVLLLAPLAGEAVLLGRHQIMAPAFAREALERSLAGCPLSFEEVGRRVDARRRTSSQRRQ